MIYASVLIGLYLFCKNIPLNDGLGNGASAAIGIGLLLLLII